MTDKVQKIREEVVRMHNLLPVVDGDNIYINYADRICTTLEMYIDSLQEEHEFQKAVKIAREEELDRICEWIGKQKELLEDSFSDPNDFADILKQAMKDE